MKKHAKGFTLVELLVVIAILGVLMGALVPNIMGAIAKSQMTAMAANGKKIVDALIAESVDGNDIWPHLTEKDGLVTGESDEIFGNTYGSSTEYFKKLFDIDRQTSQDWKPYVDNKLLECLWGNGVNPAPPGNLQQANVAWTIVAGASGVDNIPAPITRNADTSTFPTSGTTDMSKRKEEVPLTKYPTPFGTKGCVVIMKDSSANKMEARKCKLNEIYNKRVIIIPESVNIKYLEP